MKTLIWQMQRKVCNLEMRSFLEWLNECIFTYTYIDIYDNKSYAECMPISNLQLRMFA